MDDNFVVTHLLNKKSDFEENIKSMHRIKSGLQKDIHMHNDYIHDQQKKIDEIQIAIEYLRKYYG
jgi:hypothetical protein